MKTRDATGNRRWRMRAGGAATRQGIVPVIAVLPALALLGGCHTHDDCSDGDWCWNPDVTPPAAPTCLWSVTGDEEVLVLWCANTEEDLAGYRIYRSTRPDGYFPRLASVGASATSFVDREVHNGETYWYVLAAFDHSGNESALTTDAIHDTPRPEGSGLRIYNARPTPERSGYDFSEYRVIDFRDLEADIYFWHSDEEGAWMIATERSTDVYTDIQDAGYVALDDVDWAPEEGWSPNGEVALIEGHTYIVWTWDDHYAKFRVASVSSERALVEWAYQVDPSNPELLVPGGSPRAAKTPGGGARAHAHGGERRIES
jgi:hypothetical protein